MDHTCQIYNENQNIKSYCEIFVHTEANQEVPFNQQILRPNHSSVPNL